MRQLTGQQQQWPVLQLVHPSIFSLAPLLLEQPPPRSKCKGQGRRLRYSRGIAKKRGAAGKAEGGGLALFILHFSPYAREYSAVDDWHHPSLKFLAAKGLGLCGLVMSSNNNENRY